MKSLTSDLGRTQEQILIRPCLQSHDLLSLLTGDCLALRIPQLLAPPLAQVWGTKLSGSQSLTRYGHAQDVGVNRIGMTLFETESEITKITAYLKAASRIMPHLECTLGEGQNPLHILQASLKEAWKEGAEPEKLFGLPMVPGIVRSFDQQADGGLPPHTDLLAKDFQLGDCFRDMKAQLAANLFIQVPAQGGELEIWNLEPAPEELQEWYTGTYDFIDRGKLPAPTAVLQPAIGELILFRSSCIHAVRPISAGGRATASCFIGYYGPAAPLSYWA
ncbi:MAG: 2OG-Fe(II) oxygenase [Bacteroidota bacterium]